MLSALPFSQIPSSPRWLEPGRALPAHSAQNHRSKAHTPAGFTLIEVLVVVSLLALVLGMGLPAGHAWLQRQRLGHAAETVLNDLYLARSEALHGARNVIFRVIQSAGGTCYVIHSGPLNACSCELTGPPTCRADAQALKQAQWPRRPGYPNLLSNVSSMLFSGRQGTTSLAATLQVRSEGVGEVRHVVSITGRVRSCSADHAFMRWARC
ncbi:N-terminal methylation site-containing protein [Roseateles sp. YR242]|uniref:GspH/FimT family pseudopilin n=1 Tax=Roseateles sp. YR242 TaxID=1855305 RepID=UPI0008BA5655|nr:GspH/FimT family pseudopilin [Roseateles sp. YR242]SEL07662.1 N-terminal methylation site-containing protein [Roseateles sp. YR242]